MKAGSLGHGTCVFSKYDVDLVVYSRGKLGAEGVETSLSSLVNMQLILLFSSMQCSMDLSPVLLLQLCFA